MLQMAFLVKHTMSVVLQYETIHECPSAGRFNITTLICIFAFAQGTGTVQIKGAVNKDNFAKIKLCYLTKFV